MSRAGRLDVEVGLHLAHARPALRIWADAGDDLIGADAKGVYVGAHVHLFAADLLWGATGAFGVTALVLAFFTRFRPPESKVRIALDPVVTTQMAAFTLHGTF